MKITEIQEGQIFTIGETPSYPKLRTTTGYIDMRDRIVKDTESTIWECRLMTNEEILQKFSIEQHDLDRWIKEVTS